MTRRRSSRERVTTYPIASRSFKVRVDDFAAKSATSGTFADFWNGLPRILAASSLRRVAAAIHGG